jgi:hypothetical protein
VSVPAALQHPSSLETARLPSGPFHLSHASPARTEPVSPARRRALSPADALRTDTTDARSDTRRAQALRTHQSINLEVAQASTIADCLSEIAAATRSAMRCGVKPISSCRSAGLPCVT